MPQRTDTRHPHRTPEDAVQRGMESPNLQGIPFLANVTGTNSLAYLAQFPVACPVTQHKGDKTVERGWFKLVEGVDGKGCTLLTENISRLSRVALIVNDTPYEIPEAYRNAWEAKKSTVPFDGARLSLERVVSNGNSVTMITKPALYSQLAVFRGMLPDEIPAQHTMPNLLTVYGLTETKDGYLVLALRDGAVSDQSDITCTPAGFIDRPDPKNSAPIQETIEDALLREFKQELCVTHEGQILKDPKFTIKDALHMGVAAANSKVWDVTNLAYLPVPYTKDELTLPVHARADGAVRGEHQLHIYIPNNLELIKSIIASGVIEIPDSVHIPFSESAEMKGRKLPLAGLVLGALFQYVRARESKIIFPEIRRHYDTEIKFSTSTTLRSDRE